MRVPGLSRNFDTIEIAVAGPADSGGIVVTDAPEVMRLHFGGERAVDQLAQRRRRESRKPVDIVPALAPPAMGELDGADRAMAMKGGGHAAILRDDGVDGAVDLTVVEGVLDRDGGGAAELDEPDAALRLLALIGDVAFGDVAMHRIARRVAGRQEAIGNGDALERQRAKQRIEGRHGEACSSDQIEAVEDP